MRATGAVIMVDGDLTERRRVRSACSRCLVSAFLR